MKMLKTISSVSIISVTNSKTNISLHFGLPNKNKFLPIETFLLLRLTNLDPNEIRD